MLTPITDDIFQIRLPLPFALSSINCYLLRGDGGWTVMDTGLNTSKARAVWEAAFAELDIAPQRIEQIVLTHTHPDHYGLAGWLQSLSGAPVRMSAREAEMATAVWGNLATWAEASNVYWRRCGLPDEMIAAVTASALKTGERTFPHPETVTLIEPDTTVRLGRRAFTVLAMPGHSDGQIVFYDAADGLLLVGDHVLIKITPNIGLWPDGAPDPLGSYLDTFPRLRALGVRLALPGHGPLIEDLPARLAQLETHHDQRLAATETAVAHPSTVYDISGHLFNHGALSMHEVRFAATETLAHLEYLRLRGRLTRCDENGRWCYQK